MYNTNDLQILLRAVKEGVISPILLAEIANSWTPGDSPSIMSYLVEHGYLSHDQVQKLATNAKSTSHSQRNAVTAEKLQTPVASEDPSTKTFLDTDAKEKADTVDALTRMNEPTAPPLSVERYTSPNPYRRGGLGQVWRVQDKLIGREVALKTLRSDRLDNPIHLARFSREARITGQLEHPSVVPLYDLLYFGDKLCYTMRFLDGRTLAEAIADYHKKRLQGEDKPLDLAALLDVFVQVCRSVAYAHSRGICHRDLKGQNIILGEFGEVFLVDWGLGKHVDEPEITDDPETKEFTEGNDDQLTKAGAIIGTPGFMAPEVASGSTANKSSDVYGLGAILHTILCGEIPFKGSSARDVMSRCQREDPQPPREINPAISPALQAICAKAMARNPQDRYADANALANDVRSWLADEPVKAFRDSLSVRALRFAKRHRTGVTAAGVLLLTSVVALSAGSFFVWKEKERTVAQKEIAEKNFNLAFDASNGGFEIVQATEPILSSRPETMASKKNALIAGSNAFREFLKRLPVDESLQSRASALFRINANAHRFDGELSLAEPLYVESLALAEQISDKRASLAMQSQILRDQAQMKAMQGKLTEALAIDDRCKTISDKLFEEKPDDPNIQRLVALNELDRSAILSTMGRHKEAEDAALRSVKLFEKLVALQFGPGSHVLDPLLYGAVLNRLATELRYSGKIEEASQLHFNAVEQYQLYLGKVKRTPDKEGVKPATIEEFDPRKLEGTNLADVYHLVSRVRYERAQTVLLSTKQDSFPRMILAVIDQWTNLTVSHPKTHVYRSSLANAYLVRGEWLMKQKNREKEAKADFEKAREISEDLTTRYKDMSGHHASLGRAWFGLARLDKSADSLAKAESAMKKAVEMSPENVEDKKELEQIRSTKF